MDRINNLVNALKTGYAGKHLSVKLPYNTLTADILSLLRDLGFISSIEFDLKSSNSLAILKYDLNGTPSIRSLAQISRPGSRVFVSYKQIRTIAKNCSLNNAYQVIILSTPLGIVSHQYALMQKVGGEVLMVIN